MLTKSALRDAIGKARGAWYWRLPGRFAHKPGIEGKRERVALILEYRRLRAELAAGRYADEINTRGNRVLRDRDADEAIGLDPRARLAYAAGMGDRYAADAGACRSWIQFDTPQDASYFGVWIDPERRRTFTYCEGDRTLVECPTLESFRSEVADAAAFYGAPIPAELARQLA